MASSDTTLAPIDADFAVLSELLGKFIMLDVVAAILRKILLVCYCCCCNLRIVLVVSCANDFGCFAVVAAFLRMCLAAFDVVAAEFWRFSLFIVTAEIASLLFAVSWSLC
ncbi:hypothetical protein U1Q18_025190 [Sarracenia purpurea var. burkii]